MSRFSTDGLSIPAPPPGALDPADSNYSEAWTAGILGPLGLTVVCVQMARCTRTSENAGFIESLGERMQATGLGHFDSLQWEPHVRFFFNAPTERLAEALNLLKSGLEHRGLMDIAAIGHYDAPERTWRQVHPGIEEQK